MLGRLVLKAGKKEEGEKELLASQQIRDRMNRPDAARDAKMKSDPELAEHVAEFAPAAVPATLRRPFRRRQRQDAAPILINLKPAIADAYNNLGVIKAGQKDFASGAGIFPQRRRVESDARDAGSQLWHGCVLCQPVSGGRAVRSLAMLQKQPEDATSPVGAGAELIHGAEFQRQRSRR